MFGMADVYATLFIFIGILLSYPALLISLRFLFPNWVGKTAARLQYTPWVCVLVGIPVAGVLILLIAGMVSAAAGCRPAGMDMRSAKRLASAMSGILMG